MEAPLPAFWILDQFVFDQEGASLWRWQGIVVETACFAVGSSFENNFHHLLNLWLWGKFLNLSKPQLLYFGPGVIVFFTSYGLIKR